VEDAVAAPDAQPGATPTDEPIAVCVVTGMSGAGKSAVANVLEDLGWWVVDNLPPLLLPDLVASVTTSHERSKVGVVVDVRGGALFADLDRALATLRRRGTTPTILFLEAADDALVRRYESVRRPHPLQGEDRILDGIARERAQVADVRAEADVVVDTSQLTVHQLARRVRAMFGGDISHVRVVVMSFGFKYGIPLDADMVVDLRFLPNPFWVPELKAHTGEDADVAEYVLGQPRTGEFVDTVHRLVGLTLPGFAEEGKAFLTLAVGCTGGKHRSVAVTRTLAARLREDGHEVGVVHRDLGRE